MKGQVAKTYIEVLGVLASSGEPQHNGSKAPTLFHRMSRSSHREG